MVVIHLKKSETDSFLYEATLADTNDKVVRDLCLICGLRDKLAQIGILLAEG